MTKEYNRKYYDTGIRTRNKSTQNYYVKSTLIKTDADNQILNYVKQVQDKYLSNPIELFKKIFNNAVDSELQFNIQDYREFIKDHFYLSKEYTAFAGSIDISLNTWLTPSLFNDLVNSNIENVVVKKSAQLGFTTIMLILSLLFILKRKQSVLYILPFKDMVSVFWRTKVLPLIKNSDKLKRFITTIDNQTYVIETTRGNLIFSYASSPSALASHSCPIVIMDEVSKYKNINESNAIELAKERAKTYKNKKFIIFSTPTTKDNIFENTFNLYPIKQFHIKCPECNQIQLVEFNDFKQFDNNVYYESKCGHFLTDDTETLCSIGDYTLLEQYDNLNGISYVIPTYLSKFVDFNTIYKKYLEASSIASKDIIQSFENNYLAKTFDHSILRMKIKIKSMTDSEIKNELTHDNIKMFTGIDVGENFIYVLSFITNIDDKNSNIIVIDYRRIDFDDFSQIIDKIIDYKPFGKTPDRIGMDFGYRTNELRVLFGNYQSLIPIRGRTTETIRNQKILYNSNTKLIEIFSHFFKTKIATLMEQEKLLFCKATEKLIKHMGSHECYLDPRDGTILWKSKFSEGYEDHYLDALLYAYISYYVSVEM